MGFLARLHGDARGNALAMMAAMMIPLAGLSGSAIDMGRLYTVKSRLQQACDAGVLAGRKFMTDSASSTLDSTASTQATNFFNNNFKTGWFRTNTVSFSPSKTNDNQVAGTASATVPMTIMTMFGIPAKVITVTCQAQFDVADTDIVFVLDTTGSMACTPSDSDSDCTNYVGAQINANAIVKYARPADSALGASSGSVNSSVAGYPGSVGFYVPEKNGSRIAALRTAVVNFYNTLDTAKDPTTHIRYGFVTYTSTVNAGRAIMDMSPSYMVGGSGNALQTWKYRSRVVTKDYQISGSASTKTGANQTACNTYNVARNPTTALTYASNGQATDTISTYNSNNKNCDVNARVLGPVWIYQQTPYNVSSYLTNASITDPSRVDSSTAQWQGCIEERNTVGGTSTWSTLPPDLDPDLIPDPTDTTGSTSWRPMFPEVEWAPFGGTTTSNGDPDAKPSGIYNFFNATYNGAPYYMMRVGASVCGKPIRRVASMSQTDVSNYVNASDFRAIGGTYHDSGMIWGVRLLSRDGIFKDDNGAWPGRLSPNRVIVFLTDGDMAPTLTAYSLYGVEYYDTRVTNGNFSSQTDYHNARFLAECAKAKQMNINIWTVSIAPSATTQMQTCATTTSQALYTTSGSDLSTKFQAIAKQIAMLRISK